MQYVQPPREYSCIYTLRLKSTTAEKWRCYSCCGNSEDYNGGKHSRDMRLFALVLQVVLPSQQRPRFSPASMQVSSTAKSPNLQKLQIYTRGFSLLHLRKGRRQGCKTRRELSAGSKMTCLRRCFIYGDIQIKQSQRSLGINQRRGIWFLRPSSTFFQTFYLSLGEEERDIQAPMRGLG